MLEPLEVEIRTLHAILGSELDPDGRAFAPLADAYRRAGQPRKAIGLLTDGLSRLPDFVTGHVVAARLYAEQGLLEEGELAARRALELDSENVSALAVLVRVLDATGRTDEAGEAFAALEALEPEILAEEEVARPEPVMDMADLAPDEEPVLDMADLAPDEEPVMDIGALAPESEDDVLDVASLAPEPEEDAIDVAALAPEPEEDAIDVAALAPEPEVPTIDVAALAPEPEDDAIDVAALAPEPEEPAIDVASLAPEPEPEEAPAAPRSGSAPRIYTRTLGELYAKQGFVDRAVEVFRQLRVEHPDDEGIAQRLHELESQLDGSAAPAPEAQASEDHAERARVRDEELEALARDLAEHRERQPEIDTPFAWTDSEDPDEGEGASEDGNDARIGDYFQSLLGYRSGGGAE